MTCRDSWGWPHLLAWRIWPPAGGRRPHETSSGSRWPHLHVAVWGLPHLRVHGQGRPHLDAAGQGPSRLAAARRWMEPASLAASIFSLLAPDGRRWEATLMAGGARKRGKDSAEWREQERTSAEKDWGRAFLLERCGAHARFSRATKY